MVMLGRQRKPRKTIAKRSAVRRPRAPMHASIKRNIKDLQYFDQTIGSGAVGTTMIYQTLFFPTQGTTATSRYGDRTSIKSIRWNFRLNPGSGQAANITCRVVLFWDNQPNGANPSSPLPLLTASIYALPHPDYRYRFTILRDFLIPVQPISVNQTGFSSNSNQDVIQRGYLRNLDFVSQFISNNGNVTDLASGALCMIFISDTAVVVNQNPTVDGICRCLYTS